MSSRWVCLVVALLVACGQTRRDPDADAPGGAPSGGASSMGAASNGAAAGKAEGGSSASGGTGIAGGSAPIGGEGGAAPNLAHCSAAYTGLQGGPRQDGPPPTTVTCSAIPDEVILQRYADAEAKVPSGLYYEITGPIVQWDQTCSDAIQVTIDRAGADLGKLAGGSATDWFYEAEFCKDDFRRLYRQPRCDYFDGSKFAGITAEELAFLASLLWWQTNANTDAVLLGYAIQVGNATDWVEMCSLETVHGDFGLCDEISLYSTSHALKVGGEVMLGEPKLVRTLKGACH